MSFSRQYPFMTRVHQHFFKILKAVIGRLVIGLSLEKVIFRKIALIIVFHRVNDRVTDDPMTCGADKFRRYCTFFQRHFKVVSLTSIVDKLDRRESFNCELSITFDDGYEDNYKIAAPILKSLRLPATFFVTTNFMGTDEIPWWDKEKCEIHKWMTWDQVISLHTDGFEIGSHTCSHVDIARAPANVALHEIADSRKDLEARLNAPVHLFAYPYGGREFISTSAKSLIKKAGYRCCRGYGAINTSDSDPYDLCGIPWSTFYISPYHVIGDMVIRILIKSKRF